MGRHSSRLVINRAGPKLQYNTNFHPLDVILHPVRARNAIQSSQGGKPGAAATGEGRKPPARKKKSRSAAGTNRKQTKTVRVGDDSTSGSDIDVRAVRRSSRRNEAKTPVLYDVAVHPQVANIPGPVPKGNTRKSKVSTAAVVGQINFEDADSEASEPDTNYNNNNFSSLHRKVRSNQNSKRNSSQSSQSSQSSSNKNMNSIMDSSVSSVYRNSQSQDVEQPTAVTQTSDGNGSSGLNYPSSIPILASTQARPLQSFLHIDDDDLFAAEDNAVDENVNSGTTDQTTVQHNTTEYVIPPLYTTVPSFTPINNVIDDTLYTVLELPLDAWEGSSQPPAHKRLRTLLQRSPNANNPKTRVAAKTVCFRDFGPYENVENHPPHA